MICNRLRNIIVTLLVAIGCVVSNAAGISVRAQLDTVTLLMGRVTTLNLTVQEPTSVSGKFIIFDRNVETGIIPICGDSIELRFPTKRDTVVEGNYRKIKLTVPVQAFDSGAYKLPPFEYVAGRDTALTNSVALKVTPVPVKADTPIDGYAGLADPEDASIFDYIPDWVLDYWWILIIAVLLVLLAIYTIRKYRRDGSLLPPKPEPKPYDVAISALNELKEKKLWEQGMEKEYFTELTDILRVYLQRRFGINAMEMTSRQILASLKKNEETRDKRQYFRQILDMADFVKFAKVRPLPEDNIASLDNAIKFVEETKPVEIPAEEQSAGKDKEKRKEVKNV